MTAKAPEVRDHSRALGTSSELTQTWRRMYRPMAVKVRPERVLRALHRAGIRPVLMGTHGIGGWRSGARATVDVDVLVRMKDVAKAQKVLRKLYPTLIVRDTRATTRFVDPELNDVVIDLMKPTQRIFRLVFRQTVSGGETHDIPNLEMALVSKFAAMTSPRRGQEKKFIDAGDFINVVRHNRDRLNLRKLKRLAGIVYPDGGTEILKLVDDILNGRKIEI